MGAELRVKSPVLPVPNEHFPFSIPATDIALIGWETGPTSVSGNYMPLELLLLLWPKFTIWTVKDTNLEWNIKQLCSGTYSRDITLLSRLVAARYFPSGDLVTAGIECMPGSAMYLKSTGMSHSHTRTDLSSDVVTNLRLLSMNVIVLIGFKWRSYC